MITLIEDLSPQGPVVAFDLYVETLWAGVMSTLRAARLFSAERLVAELHGLFGHMERLAAMAGSEGRAEVLHQLRDMRVFAESMFPVETVSAWSSGEPRARTACAHRIRGGPWT